jgi:hypothetical protein
MRKSEKAREENVSLGVDNSSPTSTEALTPLAATACLRRIELRHTMLVWGRIWALLMP